MPIPLQVKLLRVLQERKVRPLGSNRDIDINVRIISATHRDLPKAMARGEFREDLFYRLNVVNLKIPALAERAEDIPLLANHLLRQAADRHKPFVRAFSTDAMKRLMTAGWPGNVRQLVNVIEQCVALTSSPVISDALVEQALEGRTRPCPRLWKREINLSSITCASCCKSPKVMLPTRREWPGATVLNFTNCSRAMSWMPTTLKSNGLANMVV
jgi:two-component system response regulator GlrR